MSKNTAVAPKAQEKTMATRQFVIQKRIEGTAVGVAWEDITVPNAKNASDAMAWLKRNATVDNGEPTVQPGIYRVARIGPNVNLAVQTVSKAILT